MGGNDTNKTLGMPTYVYVIIICVAAVLLAVAIFFILRNASKKKKIRLSNEQADKKVEDSAKTVSSAFGGKENILNISSQGSRVSITLKDISLADKEKINSQYQDASYRGNKIILVIGSKSEEFRKKLEEDRK